MLPHLDPLDWASAQLHRHLGCEAVRSISSMHGLPGHVGEHVDRVPLGSMIKAG